MNKILIRPILGRKHSLSHFPGLRPGANNMQALQVWPTPKIFQLIPHGPHNETPCTSAMQLGANNMQVLQTCLPQMSFGNTKFILFIQRSIEASKLILKGSHINSHGSQPGVKKRSFFPIPTGLNKNQLTRNYSYV